MSVKEEFEKALVNNICNIWFNWKIWKNLEENKDIFWYKEEDATILVSIQRAVWEKWILWLMKVLDDTDKDDNKKTLSLKEYKNTYLLEEEKKLVEDFFKSNCNEKKKIIELRNNYFCHSDKKYYLDWLESLFKKNELKYENLENILQQIIDLLEETTKESNEMKCQLGVTEDWFNHSWHILKKNIKKVS